MAETERLTDTQTSRHMEQQESEQPKPVRFEWLRQFPKIRFPTEPDRDFELVKRADLKVMMDKLQVPETSRAAQRLYEDHDHLKRELMPLFHERDHTAKHAQNRYRLYQLSFIGLAVLATLIGSMQVWMLNNAPDGIAFVGAAETIVALFTTFVANLMTNERPFSAWMINRQIGENLRREYFRYLTDAKPYTKLTGAKRRQLLALRAALINDEKDPDKVEKFT